MYFSDVGTKITAINIVDSPWDESEDLVMVGQSDGKVDTWIIDSDQRWKPIC